MTLAVATNLRKIVIYVKVVILERGVLLRVENLKQRRCGIAAEVRSHLVHFVEQEDGVLGARALHMLDDLTRQRADVGAAMAANLSFVAHATER
jgi:hypothetical protein